MRKRMKLITLMFFIIMLISLKTMAQDTYQSRFGKLEITTKEETNEHSLIFNSKVLYEFEGDSMNINQLLKGYTKDYIILELNYGGIACPTQFVIIELGDKETYKVSDEFGGCSDIILEAKVEVDKITISTPTNIPHPELLSKRELYKRQHTKEVYAWYNGKLVKRLKPLTKAEERLLN